MTFISVDLPAPFSPASAWISPRRSSKLDAAQRLDRTERLAQVGDRQDRVVGRAGRHGSGIP